MLVVFFFLHLPYWHSWRFASKQGSLDSSILDTLLVLFLFFAWTGVAQASAVLASFSSMSQHDTPASDMFLLPPERSKASLICILHSTSLKKHNH